MQTINRTELDQAIKSGRVTVVDALPAAPFANRHLPCAVNLTIEEMATAGDVLPDKSAAIVTYSSDASCNRGPELAEALTAAGYTDVRNYADGITDWAAAGLPLETGAAAKGTADDDTIREVVQRWAELERTQNADGYAGLLTEAFTGIGPVGFVLDAQLWADRHRGGDLINHAFGIADIQIAGYGNTAVVHAVETQRTTARGHENNGSFRAGLTLIRDTDNNWKIASIQLSGPMIQPGQMPPFAR